MIRGSCHCGAVSFELAADPEWLTECNCSICRRLGTLWAHGTVDDIKITCREGATLAYVWGDQMLAFHTCKTCGCTTHWENLHPEGPDTRMAVNCRMADPADLRDLPVRHFDGAETWQFLD